MFDTMKICNFRNCNDDPLKCPHDVVNPCQVFRHNPTGHWYYELTGAPVRLHGAPDGTTFNTQEWLESQFWDAAALWKKGMQTHEDIQGSIPKQPVASYPASAPKHTQAELDTIADQFIRTSGDRAALVRKVKELGQELHGYGRLSRKFGTHPMLKQRIRDIAEERDALREVQSRTDKLNNHGKKHLRESNEWTGRWTPKGTHWQEFVLVCEHIGRMLVIDNDGLRVESQFLYLPELHGQLMESANYAEQKLGIPKSSWSKVTVLTDKIGAPIRRHGKKNANGRRIAARHDQKKYAEEVYGLIADMRAVGMSLLEVQNDEELMEYYFEHIAPRLIRTS